MPDLFTSNQAEEEEIIEKDLVEGMTVEQARTAVFYSVEKTSGYLTDIWSYKFFAKEDKELNNLCHVKDSPFLVIFKEEWFEYFRDGLLIARKSLSLISENW